jgi:hypothetical protein
MEHFVELDFLMTQAMGAQRTCAGVHAGFDLQKFDMNVKRCSQVSRLKASSLAYNPQCKQRRHNFCIIGVSFPFHRMKNSLTFTSSLYLLPGCNNIAQFASPNLFIRRTTTCCLNP